MNSVVVLKIEEVPDDYLVCWEAIRRSNSEFASPFFASDYSLAIAKVVTGVKVAVLIIDDHPVAFMPFEERGDKIGRRLRWCDYQGIIASPNLDIVPIKFIGKCGLRSWEFDHLLASQNCLRPFHQGYSRSPIVDVANGYEAYLRSKDENSLKQIKEGNLKARKIERQVGTLEFRVHENSRDVLRQLLSWRWGKYPDARHSLDTVYSALCELMDVQNERLRGTLSTLYADGKLLAAHFGLRSNTVWHHWFPAYNPEFEKYSPGIVRDLRIIQAAAESEIQIIDFGNGEQLYKQNFMTGYVALANGSVDVSLVLSGYKSIRRNARALVRACPRIEGILKRLYEQRKRSTHK